MPEKQKANVIVNHTVALAHLANGEGMYAIGCFTEDDQFAQECRFRREYALAVLNGEDADAAWTRIKLLAQAHYREVTVNMMIKAGVSEQVARGTRTLR